VSSQRLTTFSCFLPAHVGLGLLLSSRSFNLDRAKAGALMYVTLNAPERQLFFSLETDGPTRVLVVSEARECAR
jgi:hypothetical protein